jgi:hypothetical protein
MTTYVVPTPGTTPLLVSMFGANSMNWPLFINIGSPLKPLPLGRVRAWQTGNPPGVRHV